MTPEVSLRREICAYLKSKGALIFVHDSVGIYDPKRKCFRTNVDPYRRKGVCDILGIWEKRFLGIEVKVKGNYATREQKEFLADVNKYGGIGFVARSIDDVKSVMFADLNPPGACF